MTTIRQLWSPSLLFVFFMLLISLVSAGNFFEEQKAYYLSLHHGTSTQSPQATSSDDWHVLTASPPPRLRNATPDAIESARLIVNEAIAEASKRNKARLEHPGRNNYKLKPGTKTGSNGQARIANSDEGDHDPPPPLLNITPEISAAAALVAEADMAASNATRLRKRQASGRFWMEHIDRRGTYPQAWGGSPGYKVFRNVKDYNAVGDGVTDDTEAIRAAIFDGDRCGEGCNGATNKNAIVYFPPGRYLVSSTIQVIFGTQLIGDAIDMPQIIAASSFVGLGVLSTNEYVPGGGLGVDGKSKQWYINTARFYSQIRNFQIDITRTDPNAYVCAMHYQVAQASSLQNVVLMANSATTQQGMFAENGSGGVMSDVIFVGGNFGFYGGNQQFTAQRMLFISCKTAVQIIWDWGWIWKNIFVFNSEVGFRLLSEGGGGEGGEEGSIGSVAFLDSEFNEVGTAILVEPPSQQPGTDTTGLIIENCIFRSTTRAVADTNGRVLLAPGPITHWVLGPVYTNGVREWTFGRSNLAYTADESLLGPQEGSYPRRHYFERPRPQYDTASVSTFVHIKDFGAVGDGVTDDTSAVQDALDSVADGTRILLVDAGVYILRDTVTIPKDAKIVGECWATFAAQGARFSDANNPRVVIRVGEEGDVGNVEMQDLIVLTKGGTAGAVLIEWNVKAESQGSAALWDVHTRVGGALGTDQNPDDCPPLRSGTNPARCQVAAMLMHITPQASGYFENMWLWVADHIIDDPDREDPDNDMEQLSIYVARGILIESREAVWLYGTSSEHCVFYQYNFYGARNIWAGMIQTEPPYFQPTPNAPNPFRNQLGIFPGDPFYNCDGSDFDGCDTGWAVIITRSENIMIAAAGTYSWFDTYTQDCISLHECQKAIWNLEHNYDNVRIQHMITIGGKYSLVSDGVGVLAIDNLATQAHPRWSHISLYQVQSHGQQPDVGDGDEDDGDGVVYIDPEIWEADSTSSATVQCRPPCTFVFPPSALDEPTTISFPPYSTSLEIGWWETFTFEDHTGSTVTTTDFVVITKTTTLTIEPLTLTEIEIWNEVVESGETRSSLTLRSSVPIPEFTITQERGTSGSETNIPTKIRSITPPPWPWPTDEEDSTPTTSRGSDDDDDDDDLWAILPPIIFIPGMPGPICLFGCGTRCIFGFCTTPCLKNCPPGSYNDFSDPDNPNKPDPSPTDSCTTTTTSYCNEVCIERPRPSCTSSCSDVIACRPTGTDIASGFTPAPGYVGPGDHNPGDGPSLGDRVAAAEGIVEYLSSHELMDDLWSTTTTTTAPPPPPATPPYPTATAYPTDSLCYKDHPDLPRADQKVPFPVDPAARLAGEFCTSTSRRLLAANTHTTPNFSLLVDIIANRAIYVIASMRWAPDQSGCGTKENILPGDPDVGTVRYSGCIEAFQLILRNCEYDGSDDTRYLGGGWIFNTGMGCILIQMFAQHDIQVTGPPLDPWRIGEVMPVPWGYNKSTAPETLEGWNV